MNVKEAAKRLGKKEEEILSLIENGRLKARRRGSGWSISEKALLEFEAEIKEKKSEEKAFSILREIIEREGEFARRENEEAIYLLTAKGHRFKIEKKTGKISRY